MMSALVKRPPTHCAAPAHRDVIQQLAAAALAQPASDRPQLMATAQAAVLSSISGDLAGMRQEYLAAISNTIPQVSRRARRHTPGCSFARPLLVGPVHACMHATERVSPVGHDVADSGQAMPCSLCSSGQAAAGAYACLYGQQAQRLPGRVP